MRILVTALAPSHLLCMVPLAWAARAAGHEVLVAGRAEVVRAAERAGLCAAEVDELEVAPPSRGRAVEEPALPRMAEVLAKEQLRGFAGHRWASGGHPWQVRVARVIDGYLAAARAWRPDVVLCDPIEFAGLLTGAVLGVPVVVHRWGGPDSMSAEAITRARGILGELAAGLGLAGGIPAPAAVLDPCPPSLRLDPATVVRPMRFVPYNGPQPVPDWVHAPGSARRIVVGFGVFGSRAAVAGADFVTGGDLLARLGAIGEALRPWSGHEVVMAVPQRVRDALGPLPEWIRVVERAPLDALFARCDLVVHHGGTGTAMTACARGVPQLLLPPEHPALLDCARGLERGGVGRVLEGAAATDPQALRAEAGLLLEGPEHRARALLLAGEVAAQPAPAELVSVLEGVAGGSRNGSSSPGSTSRTRATASWAPRS
ncbi:nucleotide disphospho-sugar-binding domain-containing protein [Kitasatospora sp. NPDC101157]|uniref:nucleotide disphospho-sugar-binding domain-containing protein n=1 Tax=Kitasatospora sp. NPDC101157 TaxID=3364098 RepID=UPI003808C6B6